MVVQHCLNYAQLEFQLKIQCNVEICGALNFQTRFYSPIAYCLLSQTSALEIVTGMWSRDFISRKENQLSVDNLHEMMEWVKEPAAAGQPPASSRCPDQHQR